ncbi:MAG: aminotransferase class IV [Armatimonadota bacterium]
MTHYASINGAIIAAEKATISIRDRGLLFGDGLYETIQVRSGRCIRFDEHMARLRSGAGVLGLFSGIQCFDFSHAIFELLRANNLENARVRVTITRGSGAGPSIIITADALPEFKMETSRAIISSCYRRDEKSPLAVVKTLNCLPSVMARMEAEVAGADDAILLNTSGNVAEGSIANVFVIMGNKLATPSLDQGCLPGTVRAAVLEIAPTLGFDVEEAAIHPDTLFEADEIFFSSAIKLLRPIIELNSKRVGAGSYQACEKILTALLRQTE